MQRRAFARQQVVVDHLAQQRVAEPVPAVVVGDQDVALDGLAHGVAQRALVEPARLGEHGVLQPLADRDEPQDLLRRLGQPLDPQHERVAQRVGGGAEAVDAGRQQLLREQRVAARALPQPVQQLGVGRFAEDVGQLVGQLVVRERIERHAVGARVALQLGEQRPQRVPAVQLVGAVGADDEHPLGDQAVGEERQRRAGRAVGPVQVLDDQDHGLLARQRVEQRQQPLEQPRLRAGVLARVDRLVGRAEAREERADGRTHGVGQRRVAGAGERPQGRYERHVRELASPRSTQSPIRTSAPRSRARACNSASSRVLPRPDSPATSAIDGRPSQASVSAASSAASSAVRPISRELETRVVSAAPCRDRGRRS